MNKPVAPWTGTKGLHKEKISEEINKKHKMSEKSMKKGVRKQDIRRVEKERKHTKSDLAAAHKHMKAHGG